MADRTTEVRLVANVNGYIQGMSRAAQQTRALGTEASKLAAQKQGFEVLGRAAIAIGAAAAVGVALAVKSFADFDAKMSQVKALSHATADEMELLATAALHMGQAIGVSATQVADAEVELVKAGVSVKDILAGALAGSLQLAAAGQIDVAQATEIATIALTQFGLKGAQIPHVADLLAAGADKALGGVGDLGEALKSGGLVAAQFGVSLDETVGTLSAFANAGLLGETAGTDLRQLLLKLGAPAADASKAIKDLGLNIYDASGKFVGINSLSQQLYEKTSQLTPAVRNAAFATIFGARAIAGANVLYAEGAKSGGGIAQWTENVSASGFAAKQAAAKMDNLNGDITKLQSAFQTGLIESGSAANDVLRALTQSLTGLVAGISSLPTPVLGVVLGFGSLVAVIGLVGGTALIAVPQFARFKQALIDLEISRSRLTAGLGAATIAIAVITTTLAGLAAAAADGKAQSDALAESFDKTSGAATSYTRELIAKRLAEQGAFTAAAKAGVSQKELTDAVLAGGKQLEDMKLKIKGVVNVLPVWDSATMSLATENNKLLTTLYRTSTELDNAQGIYKDVTKATDSNTTATMSASDAYKAAADKAATLESNLTDLLDTINKANGVGQDAVSTNAAYQQALADVADTIKQAQDGVDGFSTSVDESTAAGSDNAKMFADLAKKSQDAAKAQFDLDHNVGNYQDTVAAGRQTLYDQILALTGSADAAQTLTDKIYAIPSEKDIQVLVDTQTAATALDTFLAQYKGVQIGVGTYATKLLPNENGGLYKGGVKAFENGGFPSGIYAGRQGGIHKFAEQSLPWEAYISPKPGARAQNLNIWEQTGRMLGAQGFGQMSHSSTVSNSSKIDISAHGVDPRTVTEMLYQRIGTGLVSL